MRDRKWVVGDHTNSIRFYSISAATYPVLLDDRQVLHYRLVPNDPRQVVQRQRYEQVYVYGDPCAPQGPVNVWL